MNDNNKGRKAGRRTDEIIIERRYRLAKMVEFCATPKSSFQIMEHFNLGIQAVYRDLRELKAGNYLQKIEKPGVRNGQGVTFVHTGKLYEVDEYPDTRQQRKYNTGFTWLGVRF